MKKTHSFLFVLVLSVIAFVSRVQAQNNTLYNTPQAPNFDFEMWDNPEPWGWNSSSCFEAGYGASQLKQNQSVWSSGDTPPASRGMYSAYIKVTKSSWYRYAFPFGTTTYAPMGTLTTGTLYYYKDQENEKTCIYTSTGDQSKRWAFTGRPDSIVYWAKMSENGGRNADMTVYLHNNAKLEDRNPNGTASGTVIGSANQKMNHADGNGQWVRYSLPIRYQSEETPAYLLLSFTAGNNFREVVEGDELWVDDVEFVYNPVLSIDTANPLVLAHHGNEDVSFDLPYTFFTGTLAPLDPDPMRQNYLRLYLSDAEGNFANERVLEGGLPVKGGDNIRHQGHISVNLPADILDSDKYRIRIEASNYSLGDTIGVSIYRQWYLTIHPATRYGTTNAVERQVCRDGSIQEAVATPNNEDCAFIRWEENGREVEGAAATYTFGMTRDRDLRAVFDTLFTLRFAETVGADAYFDNNGLKEIKLVNGDTARMRADLWPGYTFEGFRLGDVTWVAPGTSFDYQAQRGGTVYVLTDSIQYDFDFSAAPHAKLGKVSGSGKYKHFSTVVAEAEPASQYSAFVRWEDSDGNRVGTDPRLELPGITKGGSYRAVFEETFFHVRLRVNDAGRGYALQCAQRKPDSLYSAFDQTHIYLRAIPHIGFRFSRWEVTKDGVAQPDIDTAYYDLTDNTHLDGDYEFNAVFDSLSHYLRLSAVNGRAEGQGTYMYGKSVVLRAFPDPGHHLARWVSGGKVLGMEDFLLITVFSDTSIQAVCEPNDYRVDIRVNDTRLGRLDLAGGIHKYGETLVLNATASEGAEFRYWVIDGDTSINLTPTHSLLVQDDCHVLAVFSRLRSNVRLQVNNTLYGQAHGAGLYEWHSPVEIRAEAFAGYRFDGWRTVQGEIIPQEILRIGGIEGDTALTALFSPVVFQVRLNSNGHGAVFVDGVAGGKQVNYMDYVQINAVPETGYEFGGWYDENGGLLSTYATEGFSVDRDRVLEARFVEVRYAVSLFVSPLGAGVLHGTGRYAGGSDVEVGVDTSAGYTFLGWYENDKLYERKARFRIENLNADRYFTARFQEKRFTIGVEADKNKVEGTSGAGAYKYAYNANVHAEVRKGYEVAAWVNAAGDTLSRNNPYLHDVSGDATLRAVLRPARQEVVFGVEPDEAGKVSCGEVLYGVRTTARAEAAYGYEFSHWKNSRGESVGKWAALDFVTRNDTSFTAVFKPVKFKIQGSPRNPLRGSVSGSGEYEYLSTCTLDVSHDLHYHLGGWYDKEGELLSRQHEWTFTVTGPLDVVAYFEPQPVQTHLAVEPANGGSIRYNGGQMLGDVEVLFETAIRLQAVPSPGMKFKMWRRQDDAGLDETIADEDYAFIPQGGRRVTAVFDTLEYALSVSVEPENAGSVTGAGEYKYGTSAPLKATPAGHYRFYAYMAGDKVLSYDSACTLRMDSAMEVRAVFRPRDYFVFVVTGNIYEGQVTGTGFYPYGGTARLEAFTWNDSVEFAFWSHYFDAKDTISLEEGLHYPVRGDESLLAFFKPAGRSLKAWVTEGGQVEGTGTYAHGSVARLRAKADKGYRFTAWREYGMPVGEEESLELAMRSDRELEAVFVPDTFKLQLEAVNLDVEVFGAGHYANGREVNVWTGISSADYGFVAWKNEAGEVVSRESDFTFRISENTRLYAEWEKRHYTVDLKTEGQGSVTGSGGYGYDSAVLLTALPEAGYRFAAWSKDGKAFSDKDSLRFRIAGNLSLTAVFERDLLPVHPVLNAGARGTIETLETSDTSRLVSLMAVPLEGYTFSYWSLHGENIGSQKDIEVERSSASQVVAHFLPEVYYVRLGSSTPEGLSVLSGSGSFHKGDEARLKAELRNKYEFLGWFEEGADTPLSTDIEYSFTVSREMKIDARAKEIDQNSSKK